MQSIASIHAPRQSERHLSRSKLSIVLASFALWATLISGLAGLALADGTAVNLPSTRLGSPTFVGMSGEK